MSEAIGRGFPISFLLICWCWMLAGGAQYQWGCCFFAFCILTKWLGMPKSKAGHVLSLCLLPSILLSPVSQGLVGFSTLWHGPPGVRHLPGSLLVQNAGYGAGSCTCALGCNCSEEAPRGQSPTPHDLGILLTVWLGWGRAADKMPCSCSPIPAHNRVGEGEQGLFVTGGHPASLLPQ